MLWYGEGISHGSAIWLCRHNLAYKVDMALNEMTTIPRAGTHGAFEVDEAACAKLAW